MSDKPLWDARIWNDGQLAEKCMSMGAVILKPKGQPTVGFAAPAAEPSGGERK